MWLSLEIIQLAELYLCREAARIDNGIQFPLTLLVNAGRVHAITELEKKGLERFND